MNKLAEEHQKKQEKITLMDCIVEIDDPRSNQGKKHLLKDILVITILGYVAGANSNTALEVFGKSMKHTLKNFLLLPYGIPSHDTFGRVLSLIPSKQINEAISKWMRSEGNFSKITQIAIDGKRLKRSYDKSLGLPATTIVRAWTPESKLILGQEKASSKSNEITAIKKLIETLYLNGAVISIDAAGCQTDIAAKIKDNGGEYNLALKKNQFNTYIKAKVLLDEKMTNIKQGAKKYTENDYFISHNNSHGRKEIRKYCVSNDIYEINKLHKWKGLKSIGMVESERCINGKKSVENRYFLSSLSVNAKTFAAIVRNHWKIENSLHHRLDTIFEEDYSRIRNPIAVQNFAFFRAMAISILERAGPQENSLKMRRFQAATNFQSFMEIASFCGFYRNRNAIGNIYA